MAVSFVGYDTIYTGGDQKKSEGVNFLSADRVIARQLDELERISAYERDKHLGKDYFKEIEDFFNLEG